MSPLKRIGILLSGNRFVQRRLARHVRFCHHLMGIGSGDRPEASGERRLFQTIRQRSPGPWCIMDVGANRGQFLQMALACMPSGSTRIHCFEPGEHAFEQLCLLAKGSPHVQVNRLAIGERSGEATLHYQAPGSGLASLTRRDLTHFGIEFNMSESVQVTTIDEHCRRHGIDRIHPLKLDIEGHELDAIRGASEMLNEGRIDLLTFEFGGCNIDTRTHFRDLWQALNRHRMAVHRITPSGFWHPIDRYDEAHEQFRTTNFVAIRADP